MPVLRIQDFSGIVPVKGDRAIPDGFATESKNTWLYGSELRGVRPMGHLQDINPTTNKVLRVPKRTPGAGSPGVPGQPPPPSYLGDSIWVQFTDQDTDILKGALALDSFERYYFCSPTTGPMFNTYARMLAGNTAYRLGVPNPSAAPNTPSIDSIVKATIPAERSGPIQEIEFQIGDSGGSMSYANPGGQGNRTATITVGTTIAVDGNMNQLVNGNTSETTMTWDNIHQANKWIRFDFGVGEAKIMNEFTWYQGDTLDLGNWQLSVSNDNVSWTDIGNPFPLGGKTVQKILRTVPAPGYRFFRISQEVDPSDDLRVTRAYVYTWINEYGEESAPSLPVLGSGLTNGVWTISNIQDPPAPAANQPKWDKKRLYRTITGASGQTTFYMVTEINIPDPPGGAGEVTVYNDNGTVNTDAKLANNLTLESVSWQPPPTDLQGWVAMPNGFLIGFKDNTIFMSEPYHWHAWPPEYQQATETPIVGLGVVGQTCVVCTEGYPTVITGSEPATCAFSKVNTGEPCLTRGGIVSTPDGVLYPSQNGLVMIGPGGIQNVTAAIITREEWIRDYSPQYFRAARYQNGYLAIRNFPGATPNTGFFLDPTELKVALTEMTEFDNAINLQIDFWSGEVFAIVDVGSINAVKRWDPPPTVAPGDLMPVLWRSKEFQYPIEENFSCYAIYWDQSRYVPNTIDVDICASAVPVRLIVYAGRQVIYDEAVPRNGRPVRLPSGFKKDIWQFEIRARAPVYSLHVATSEKELRVA